MRLFGIDNKGEFKEFVEIPFQTSHQESVLEEWLESSPEGIVKDARIEGVSKAIITQIMKHLKRH